LKTDKNTHLGENIMELRLPALEIKQGGSKKLYSFGVEGKLVPSFASVSRIRRDRDISIAGYQRPEILSHIAELREYLETDEAMFPTSIVIAFNDSVRFEALSDESSMSECSRLGTLVIPVNADGEDCDKPGWIVDGQQRVAAIRDASIESFPVSAVGFIASDDREQREQFILVNSAKPLAKGLIYELLPSTDTKLPTKLRRRRFPAYLLERLNHDEESPLKGLIQTPTNPKGVIRDNSVLKMLENSLTDGVLYRFRDPSNGEGETERMLEVLFAFWEAIAQVFVQAWGLSPRLSRLTHGAGIVSM